MTLNPSRAYHIAQYNIARMIAPLDDPRIADFVAALDPINRLGDESPGFVWRHQMPEGNSTSVRVRGDPSSSSTSASIGGALRTLSFS